MTIGEGVFERSFLPGRYKKAVELLPMGMKERKLCRFIKCSTAKYCKIET